MSGDQRKTTSYRIDLYWRKRDAQLDTYAASMEFDPVKTPEDILIEKQDGEEINAALQQLAPRHERVMRAHYGIGCEPRSFRDIAADYDISASAIQQIEHKACRKLKRPLMKSFRPEAYRKWQDERLAAHRKQMAKEQEERERRVAEHRRHEAEYQRHHAADWSEPHSTIERSQETVWSEQRQAFVSRAMLDHEYRTWAAERSAWLNAPLPPVNNNFGFFAYSSPAPPAPAIERDILDVATRKQA